MAPKVQSLSEIMAELAPAYTQQTSLIQQQQAGLPAKYEAQGKALEAKKTSGFNQINNQATGRGMSFSGIPLDEQATYLAETYLPAVANLTASQNTESTALQKSLADIYSDQYTKAYGIRGDQTSALNNWNLQQMQNEFEASENAKNRAASDLESSAPTFQQYMTDAFVDAIQHDPKGWKKSGATEDIMNELAAAYGMTMKEVGDIVYPWRKEKYKF